MSLVRRIFLIAADKTVSVEHFQFLLRWLCRFVVPDVAEPGAYPDPRFGYMRADDEPINGRHPCRAVDGVFHRLTQTKESEFGAQTLEMLLHPWQTCLVMAVRNFVSVLREPLLV